MHPIIYDVAVSIDGYICGQGGDISQFAQEGAVVDAYMARLHSYDVAIMGRHSYEFGYRYGLAPGANPYPHLKCVVFSESLQVPGGSEIEVLPPPDANEIHDLRHRANGPIYLCGGGAFAGALLRLGCLDRLRLKRAPILLGVGVRLFEGHMPPVTLSCTQSKRYENGYVYQDVAIKCQD